MAPFADITSKHMYRPLALIETLQTVTIQTPKHIEELESLVLFLAHEMKAGKGGTGFKRRIIVRSTYQDQIGEEVEEVVSTTVLPPRQGTAECVGGVFQFHGPEPGY